jgi:hypothetical protein
MPISPSEFFDAVHDDRSVLADEILKNVGGHIVQDDRVESASDYLYDERPCFFWPPLRKAVEQDVGPVMRVGSVVCNRICMREVARYDPFVPRHDGVISDRTTLRISCEGRAIRAIADLVSCICLLYGLSDEPTRHYLDALRNDVKELIVEK